MTGHFAKEGLLLIHLFMVPSGGEKIAGGKEGAARFFVQACLFRCKSQNISVGAYMQVSTHRIATRLSNSL